VRSLAVRYRPVLLFDQAEDFYEPLDIDDFLASGRVELCRDDEVALLSRPSKDERCDPVYRSADLVGGSTHLLIRRPGKDARDIADSIYVHPTRRREDGRDLLYLDYWWYLAGNPARIARGASCGIGLAIPGKTCFDHPSDWEGMTVVLDMRDGEAIPVALQYAQHKDVVRYDYDQVQDYWERRRGESPSRLSEALRRNLARIEDVGRRPLAFVAEGTHATYWTLCPPRCGQVAVERPENQRDGERSWPANDTAHCLFTNCMRLMPTRHRGRDAALWNAYDGVWGDRDCILRGSYCTAEQSPASPSLQPRYKNPAKVSGYVDAKWEFHRCGGDGDQCPPLPDPGPAR
jgi:hypothetical protein